MALEPPTSEEVICLLGTPTAAVTGFNGEISLLEYGGIARRKDSKRFEYERPFARLEGEYGSLDVSRTLTFEFGPDNRVIRMNEFK